MSYTPEEIERDKRIIAAATPGPWEADGLELADQIDQLIIADGAPEGHGEAQTILDLKFIAAARTGWPKALEAIEARDKEIERLTVDLRNANHRISVQSDSLALHREQQLPRILAETIANDRATKAEAERDEAMRQPADCMPTSRSSATPTSSSPSTRTHLR